MLPIFFQGRGEREEREGKKEVEGKNCNIIPRRSAV